MWGAESLVAMRTAALPARYAVFAPCAAHGASSRPMGELAFRRGWNWRCIKERSHPPAGMGDKQFAASSPHLIYILCISQDAPYCKMMISPIAETSPFKRNSWRTPIAPQLETQLNDAAPQFSLRSTQVSKQTLGLVPNLNTYKFLVVDDNEINLRIFRRVLKRLFPNSAIDTIQDSCQVDTTKLLLYQIVFLDIEMPHVTGVDIAKTVRLDPALRNVGLVAVTTKSAAADLEAYDACGFDFTIPKPIQNAYSSVFQRIQEVLECRCADVCEVSVSGVLIPDTLEASERISAPRLAHAPNLMESGAIAIPGASGITRVRPEVALVLLQAAATAAVSELLLSITQGDAAVR